MGDWGRFMVLHLSGRKLIFHVASHCTRESRSVQRSLQLSGVMTGRRIKVSPADSLVVELRVDNGRSFIYSKNSRGSKTVPWGTPEETELETVPLRRKRWVLFERKTLIR